VSKGLFDWTLGLGDDRLILGHRLSEWCGHGPILEEELALANIALDLIGQAQTVLTLAAELEGAGRSADELAYLRDAREFRNLLLTEQPNGDFGFTIVRQFLFDAWDVPHLEALCDSPHETLAGFAAKAVKEASYHLRHSRDWIIRLGDGTEESHRRAQAALDALWRLTPEFFAPRPDEEALPVPAARDAEAAWRERVEATLTEAGLEPPEAPASLPMTGRTGLHSEQLGHLLAEMQVLPRSHPGASW
jgi:ring-1,2-phenylacetyl-CoA epoxidase subunit PaaC